MVYYVGLVGKNGAGKTTMSNLLAGGLQSSGKLVEVVKFSQILTATLKLWSLPSSRENLQLVAQVMCNQFGNDALAFAIKTQILSSKADVVILDSVRTESDELFLRSLHANVLVYVVTSPSERYKRLRERNEKVNENNLTLEQFEIEDSAINESSIEEIGSRAEEKVSNDGSSESLNIQVRGIVTRVTTAIN